MVENTDPADGTACTTNSDCSPGYVCKSGRCVKAPTGTDPTDPPVIPPSFNSKSIDEG